MLFLRQVIGKQEVVNSWRLFVKEETLDVDQYSVTNALIAWLAISVPSTPAMPTATVIDKGSNDGTALVSKSNAEKEDAVEADVENANAMNTFYAAQWPCLLDPDSLATRWIRVITAIQEPTDKPGEFFNGSVVDVKRKLSRKAENISMDEKDISNEEITFSTVTDEWFF